MRNLFSLLLSFSMLCSNAQSYFLLSKPSSTIPTYTTTLSTLVADGRYNAFGGNFEVGANKVLMTFRSGTSHASGSWLKALWYDVQSNTYGNPFDLYKDATYSMGDFRGGVLGGQKIIAFSRRTQDINASSGTHIDVGYLLSTDLTGTTWSTYNVITPPTGVTGFALSYGTLVQSDMANTYYLPCYGQSSDGLTNYLWLWKIMYASGGVTITTIPVWNGSMQISETDIANVGSGRYVMIGRVNNRNQMVQFNSTDGGLTWSGALDTNLGSAGSTVNCVPVLRYTNGKLICFYQDRATGWLNLATNNASNPTATGWTIYNYYMNVKASDNAGSFYLGYPNIVPLSSNPGVYLMTWCTETSYLTSAYIQSRMDNLSTILP